MSEIMGTSETAPSVMLSPNATKRVFVRVCGTRTVTVNPHDTCAIAESVAVQTTGVSPMAKMELEPGVH
jgi:hypothetical protein